MKNKKALSQIVGTLLMVLLTIAMIGSAWTIIDKFVLNKLSDAEVCYGITEEITFNTKYTCFNQTSNKTYVSINIKEIEVDGLLVSVDYGTESTVFMLTNNSKTIPDLANYADGSLNIQMPKSDSGKTYIVNKTERPSKVYLAPKIGTKQCDVVDSIPDVPTCL